MTHPVPPSTDDARTGQPLRHARTATFDKPLPLKLGGELPSVTVAYETYGTLDADKSNAVLICHAISGDSHVAVHDAQDDPGWWDLMVGPGRPIDTDRLFVVCPNVLGGCSGSTGPGETNPATGRPYGKDFPNITIEDMVDAQARLIDHLGIEKLLAVIGPSLGGHQALTWAIRYPRRMSVTGAIATSPRLTSQALAFDIVARNAIQRDPAYHGGQYYDQPDKPDTGLAIARMLGHITYLSLDAMAEKFDPDRYQPHDIQTDFEKKFSVGSYLAHQGRKFTERFDANSYVAISLAMDMFDLGRTPRQLRQTLRGTRCDWLVVGFSSDWLFPTSQSRAIVNALVAEHKPVSYAEITTALGHDGFLLEDEIGRYGKLLAAKLDQARAARGEAVTGRPDSPAVPDSPDSPGSPAAPAAEGTPSGPDDQTYIFRENRLDYDQILELIPAGSSVLDLGCGHGGLLTRLRDRGHDRLLGVEVSEPQIISAIQRGLRVLDYDLNKGLAPFTDDQFDVVVLSQTLQAVANVEAVIDEMLRVGRRSIISFPNFAHRDLRAMLARDGRTPKAPGEYHYEWYNTPNQRFPSIADVEDFCKDKRITIHRAVYLDSTRHLSVTDDPNLNADTAILVISRD